MNYPLWEQLEQLKTSTWVDLTHTFDETIPCFSEFERAKVSTLFNVADDGFYVQNWNIVTQYGTHIDAPIHFVEKTRYLHEIDLKELVLPLVVLDFSQEVAADADFILTREHIKQWEAEHGSIEPGTFVAFRSDWSKRWPDIERFENKDAEGQLHLPDTFQLELLTNLDQLPTRGAIIYAISPKPNKAPGFPVRAFAIKP
ncbi:cyclase family protein [Staphylococcus cohnii]|uniref:cyclase family protein n=1 Tax=Staphylococcus cohnii TaxID=29382 RepID=UPI00374E86D2